MLGRIFVYRGRTGRRRQTGQDVQWEKLQRSAQFPAAVLHDAFLLCDSLLQLLYGNSHC